MGDGKKIDVWRDKWIKKPPSFKVELPQVQSTPLKVGDLMKEGSREWNMDTVNEVLVRSDAELVAMIPLSRTLIPDKLIWRDSISGTLTVRSSYYEAHKLFKNEDLDRSLRTRAWKIIWMAKVAPKVKYFMWRMLHECLPTRSILKAKGIQMANVCPVCGIQEETIPHLFFDCWVSSDVWGSGLPGLQIQRANNRDTIKFWEDLL